MVRDRDGRRLWIQSEHGTFEPVQSHAGLLERERGQGIPDWWVVAKDPDWTPPRKRGGLVFRDGAAPAGGGHMKPNSSGQLQPYDNLGQYASPGGGGWTETSGQGRIKGTSLLSMGKGALLEEGLPGKRNLHRSPGKGKSLLSAQGDSAGNDEEHTDPADNLPEEEKSAAIEFFRWVSDWLRRAGAPSPRTTPSGGGSRG
ncbi:MAG TPA: hypothetical protein DDW80_05630 [Desulfovibrio sp.]|jgi:hypothetical protein|nr:hypothetical protein [Desulfovibrio sp.]